MSEFVDTVNVTGAFASGDHTVIGWGGQNYYLSCDEPVVTQPDGSGSHCVKRKDHPGDIHEDMHGVRATEVKGRMVVMVSYPLVEDLAEGFATTRGIMHTMSTVFKDREEIKIYAAVKETADQLIMILEGDG